MMNWEGLGRILAVLVVVVGAAGAYFTLMNRVFILEQKNYPNVEDLTTKLNSSLAQIDRETTQSLQNISDKQAEALQSIAARQIELLANLGGIVNQDGSINVAGQCFRPRTLVMCYYEARGEYDHMTWVENRDECNRAGFRLDHREFVVLGQCQ
jgi:hypothetical protein